jgi:hypothetical protein
MKLLCIICQKKEAEVLASGNSYCLGCFQGSPYNMEALAKARLKHEREEKEK